jgi:hypothetical protein
VNLINPFRDTLQRVPYLNDALDLILAKINTLWNVEHDLEGHHTDITADSLTVETATVESLEDTFVQDELTYYDDIGQFGFPASARYEVPAGIVGDGPVTQFTYSPPDFSGSSATADLTITGFGPTGHLLPGTDATYDLGSWASTDRKWRRLYLSGYGDAPYFHASSGFAERNRAALVGEWTTPAFAAGDFTASGGATWTVDAGDVNTYRYAVVGKTMTLAWGIFNTDLSAGAVLRLAIPGGFTAASGIDALYRNVNAGAAGAIGICRVSAGGTFVELFVDINGGNFTATAGDDTSVAGEMTFDVQ